MTSIKNVNESFRADDRRKDGHPRGRNKFQCCCHLGWLYFLCHVTPASLNQGPAIGLTLPQACASEEIVMSYKLDDDYKHCQGIVNYMVLIV